MTFPFLANEIPGGSKFGEKDTYTPSLLATTTNPNLGASGSAVGHYVRIGPHFVSGWARFHFQGDGLSAGSGIYTFTLPIPPDGSFHAFSTVAAGGTHIGAGLIEDASTAANRTHITAFLRNTPARAGMWTPGGVLITNSAPFTWASNDRISVFFAYSIVAGT